MKKFSLLAFFLLTANFALAQYTQSTSVNKIGTKKIDSIAVDVTPRLNMAVYNSAYDNYLRKLEFKRKNKITIKNTGLTMTQTSFSNWAAGGNNSFSTRAAAYIEHIYTDKKFDVKSVFDAAYGMILTDDIFKKNEDWFNISVTPSYYLSKHWKITGSVILKSQFTNSYNYSSDTKNLISSFFSPGELYLSFGVTYSSKVQDKFSIFLAPISGNLLMVINDELAQQKKFGMDEVGRKFKPSFGSFVRVLYNANIYKTMISYNTKLETFWDYTKNPTIWWENKLNFKFTNLLSANLYFQLKYDESVETPNSLEGHNSFWQTWQINESLGLGLVYNFKSKAPVETDVSQYVKASDVKKRKRK